MPFFPDVNESEGLPYEIENFWGHLVCQYLNCSMEAVLDLSCVDFLGLKREAFIYELSRTQEGRAALQDAKVFEAEDADYSAVRELQEILGGEGNGRIN